MGKQTFEIEQHWFEVMVGPEAVLSVRANSEEAALLKTEYYFAEKHGANAEAWIGRLALALKQSDDECRAAEIIYARTESLSIKISSMARTIPLPVSEPSPQTETQLPGQLSLDFEARELQTV